MSSEFKAQIIDVFAGPGGLGEGFAAYQDQKKEFPFDIKVSVEMEQFAHKTLRLRAFTRHFTKLKQPLPQIYIDYITNENKLLGKLLEYRDFSLFNIREESENQTRNWDLLKPSFYCLKESKIAKNQYSKEWNEVYKAIKAALYETRRMTLGPDEKDIHSAIKSELDSNLPTVLIGGPPCQAFSTVGRSRRQGGAVKNNVVVNEDGEAKWDQDGDGRTWLYQEYIKIINEFTPDVFVMENVRGMLSAKVSDSEGLKTHVWKRIFSDLNKPHRCLDLEDNGLEYDVYSLATPSSFKGGVDALSELDGNDFVLHAEEYGIPQARERVILLGVKKAVSNSLPDSFPLALAKVGLDDQTTVGNAISDLPVLRAGLGRKEIVCDGSISRVTIKRVNEGEAWKGEFSEKVKSLHELVHNNPNSHDLKVAKVLNLASSECEEMFGYPQSYDVRKSANYETSLNSILKFSDLEYTRVKETAYESPTQKKLRVWYSSDSTFDRVLNHETRSQMDSDLCRYIYSACYSLIVPGVGERSSPRLSELEKVGLDPKGHRNRESFVDRFRTQIWDEPSSTVTSHISKDGHYYIHPDPSQMRSLTVREAARLQTFPDSYFFEGPRTAQYVQVGNAVPPLLANQIAAVVHKLLKTTCSEPEGG